MPSWTGGPRTEAGNLSQITEALRLPLTASPALVSLPSRLPLHRRPVPITSPRRVAKLPKGATARDAGWRVSAARGP